MGSNCADPALRTKYTKLAMQKNKAVQNQEKFGRMSNFTKKSRKLIWKTTMMLCACWASSASGSLILTELMINISQETVFLL